MRSDCGHDAARISLDTRAAPVRADSGAAQPAQPQFLHRDAQFRAVSLVYAHSSYRLTIPRGAMFVCKCEAIRIENVYLCLPISLVPILRYVLN
uniref:Uncharacterized protein n=1 Tax=Strigamia maritima TaxID=126957 RepID=T1JA81_STRMM